MRRGPGRFPGRSWDVRPPKNASVAQGRGRYVEARPLRPRTKARRSSPPMRSGRRGAAGAKASAPRCRPGCYATRARDPLAPDRARITCGRSDARTSRSAPGCVDRDPCRHEARAGSPRLGGPGAHPAGLREPDRQRHSSTPLPGGALRSRRPGMGLRDAYPSRTPVWDFAGRSAAGVGAAVPARSQLDRARARPGLSLVKAVVEAHAGEVRLRSEVGVGSAVRGALAPRRDSRGVVLLLDHFCHHRYRRGGPSKPGHAPTDSQLTSTYRWSSCSWLTASTPMSCQQRAMASSIRSPATRPPTTVRRTGASRSRCSRTLTSWCRRRSPSKRRQRATQGAGAGPSTTLAHFPAFPESPSARKRGPAIVPCTTIDSSTTPKVVVTRSWR
jgi:hypothetical protein